MYSHLRWKYSKPNSIDVDVPRTIRGFWPTWRKCWGRSSWYACMSTPRLRHNAKSPSGSNNLPWRVIGAIRKVIDTRGCKFFDYHVFSVRRMPSHGLCRNWGQQRRPHRQRRNLSPCPSRIATRAPMERPWWPRLSIDSVLQVQHVRRRIVGRNDYFAAGPRPRKRQR